MKNTGQNLFEHNLRRSKELSTYAFFQCNPATLNSFQEIKKALKATFNQVGGVHHYDYRPVRELFAWYQTRILCSFEGENTLEAYKERLRLLRLLREDIYDKFPQYLHY